MNFTLIKYFLTLADTLNYTKASEILYTTQPNLSKSIVNLEEEVGVKLFIRTKRDVRLTPAGEIFRREAEKLMGYYMNAIYKAREVEEGLNGYITIGYLGTATTRLVPLLVSKFRELYPNIFLDLKDYTYSSLFDALMDDSVDLAIMPDRELESVPNLIRKFIFADDMCLAVGDGHEAAGLDTVDLYDMKDEFFIQMDPKISIRDHKLITGICVEQDFTPQVIYEANTLINMLMMVECNMGVSILASHMKRFATPNVHFVKIKGYENYFKMVAAWKQQNDNDPNLGRLLQAIDDIAAAGNFKS